MNYSNPPNGSRLVLAPVLALFTSLFLLPVTGHAHRLDEYLQATLVTIEQDGIRLRINLTPGVEVADKVLAAIDRNRDGIISTAEAADYGRLLKQHLELHLDKSKLGLELVQCTFPEMDELRGGIGVIQVEFVAHISPPARGPHRIKFRSKHMPAISVYLFNAARPAWNLVQVTGQKRNHNQSYGEIDFTILDAPAAAMRTAPNSP